MSPASFDVQSLAVALAALAAFGVIGLILTERAWFAWTCRHDPDPQRQQLRLSFLLWGVVFELISGWVAAIWLDFALAAGHPLFLPQPERWFETLLLWLVIDVVVLYSAVLYGRSRR